MTTDKPQTTCLGRDIEAVWEALASGATYADADATRQANEALARIGALAQSYSKLSHAAENVASRWALVRFADGKLGGCGLPDALSELSTVLNELDPEEINNDR